MQVKQIMSTDIIGLEKRNVEERQKIGNKMQMRGRVCSACSNTSYTPFYLAMHCSRHYEQCLERILRLHVAVPFVNV